MFFCFGLKIFDLNTNNFITARLKANHILTWNPKRGVLWVFAIYILMLVILLWLLLQVGDLKELLKKISRGFRSGLEGALRVLDPNLV